MEELLATLHELGRILGHLTWDLATIVASWTLLIVWVAWWLFAVNWKKTWPVLRQGSWVPLLLLCVMSTFVWSRVQPGDCDCLRFVKVPNFWWQLGEVGLIVSIALVCGWLQVHFGWSPPEIDVEPAPHGAHDDHHGGQHAPADHGSHSHHGSHHH